VAAAAQLQGLSAGMAARKAGYDAAQYAKAKANGETNMPAAGLIATGVSPEAARFTELQKPGGAGAFRTDMSKYKSGTVERPPDAGLPRDMRNRVAAMGILQRQKGDVQQGNIREQGAQARQLAETQGGFDIQGKTIQAGAEKYKADQGLAGVTREAQAREAAATTEAGGRTKAAEIEAAGLRFRTEAETKMAQERLQLIRDELAAGVQRRVLDEAAAAKQQATLFGIYKQMSGLEPTTPEYKLLQRRATAMEDETLVMLGRKPDKYMSQAGIMGVPR